MHAIVAVFAQGSDRPPVGSPIRVEARDTSYEDAPAETVGAADGEVRGELGSWLDTVELDLSRFPDSCTIWVHVDVDGDGQVSPGDYVTMAAYPVPPAPEAEVSVRVRKV